MSYILLTWLLAPIWWPISLFRKLLNPQPKRILILEIAGIGDVVCSTAVFKEVRARFPEADIALMVDTVVEDLAALDPNVNEVIPFAYPTQRGLKGRWQLMRIMRRFDTALCLIPSAAQLSAACLAALPRRYSVLPDIQVSSYQWLKPLLSHYASHQTGTNLVGTQLRMLVSLGVVGDPANRLLVVTELAQEKAAKLFSCKPTLKWIGLAVGSGQGIKAINPAVLKEVIHGLLALPDMGVVLIGGKKEQALATELETSAANLGHCINASGQWPLHLLPGLLEKLTAFIGVDSGVTYMADTLHIPLVYLPGPASPADQGPMHARRITLQKPLDCAPCSRVFVTPSACMANNHACIDSFTAVDILKAVNDMLQEAHHG